ncbi:MAG: hypothetical protein R2792_06660 [Saprospiraceae bacterium]
MGVGLVIWSKTPVHQKEILMDMVEAAYDGCLLFQLQGYKTYDRKGDTLFAPGEFVLQNENPSRSFMVFYICNFDDQQSGKCEWVDTKFITVKNETIVEPLLYRLAVSEDADFDISYYFAYHYLKKNQEQFLSFSEYLLTWDMMNKAFADGFTENWYTRLQDENK